MFTGLRVRGYRSFEDSDELPLSPLTVLVGPNNSGKSTLLRAIYQVQEAAPWTDDDVRVGWQEALIELSFDQLAVPVFNNRELREKWQGGQLNIGRPHGAPIKLAISHRDFEGEALRFELVTSREPRNLIYPSLSGRHWNNQFEEQVRHDMTTVVGPTESNLVARASTVLNARTRDGQEFRDLCERVLGQTVDIMTGVNGQRLGVQIDRYTQIGLLNMGTGVGGVLGLLLNLTGARDKVFLLEEPENDLHPMALKQLLDVIVEKSENNQFVISTHSNIVLTRLGAHDRTTVLQTSLSVQNDLPTSRVETVSDRRGRLKVLRDLGYGLADLDLADGWLIFEESSAERICRQYLIPWFAPELSRLTTVAAAGAGRIGPLWQNLHEMILFAHLQSQYAGRLWVIADGDAEGGRAIRALREKYGDEAGGRFLAWSAENFEEYYPPPFERRAQEVIATAHDRRVSAKKALLEDVLAWILEDPARARTAFEASAADAIELLQSVAAKFMNRSS